MSPPIRTSGHDKALQAALSTGVLQVMNLLYCYNGEPSFFITYKESDISKRMWD